MKAIVQHSYGSPDVLVLEEIGTPVVRPDDVLVRVHTAGLSYPDHVFTSGVPYLTRLAFGLRCPRQPVRGQELAGVVCEVGANVTDLQVGDEVFGWCADRHGGGGGFAEYARCDHTRMATKSAGLTFEQAASLPVSGVTALQAVRDWAGVTPGQRVLVNGASGGVGSFAVQIAKALGAHVTGVCGPSHVELVRSLGADTVIDYTAEDFTLGAVRYDAILDFPHYAAHSLTALRRVLTPKGILIPASNTRNRLVGGFSRVGRARLLAPFVPQRILAPEMVPNRADLTALAQLVQEGRVTPVISRTYPLAEVPDAMRDFQRGHTGGKLVISV